MSEFQLKEQQVELLIRDGFASEVYFGNTEGEYLNTDEIENLSPIVLALRSEKSTKGYKAMLYLDALARQFEYYLEYSDTKDTGMKNALIYIRPPLYIPDEIMAKINDVQATAIISARSKEEEDTIRKGYAIIKELHAFHNNEVISSFCDYITAQGVISDSSPKQFFLKALSNKKEALTRINEFKVKIVLHKDELERFIPLLKMDKIFSFINSRKMANAVLKSTDEENERMESFLSKKLRAADSTLLLTSGDSSFCFSPLAFERPSFQHNFLLPLNLFTFADLMLYSEVPLEDKAKAEKISQIRIFHEVYHNGKFKDEISEIMLVGERYMKAYAENGVGEYGDEVVKKTYQHEAYESLFDTFSKSVKTYSGMLFEAIVEKEKGKPASISVFSRKNDSFAFVFAGYVVKQAIRDKLSMLPLIENDSFLYRLQKNKMKSLVSSQIDRLASVYVEARTEYLRKTMEKGKEQKQKQKQSSEVKNKPETNKETAGGVDLAEDNSQEPNSPPKEDTISENTTPASEPGDTFSYSDDDNEDEFEDKGISSMDEIMGSL